MVDQGRWVVWCGLRVCRVSSAATTTQHLLHHPHQAKPLMMFDHMVINTMLTLPT